MTELPMPPASAAHPRGSAPDQGGGEVLVWARGLSKKFCRDLKRSFIYGMRDTAREALGFRNAGAGLQRGEFWALDRVDLTLRRGEALGLIGPNGCGKTTLLRLLSGLLKPDAGEVRIAGRLAPLIALGAGFSPLLTGRENIFVNLSVMGLSRREIAERFDAIVDFAEVGDAIDAPLRTYSSGMRARLGFGCAIHVAPEILLVDEVLAVGDMRFRTKCYRALSALREAGTALVMVSHNPITLASTVERGVYLTAGRVAAEGGIDDVLRAYEADQDAETERCGDDTVYRRGRNEDETGIAIREIALLDEFGQRAASLTQDRPGGVEIVCEVAASLDRLSANLIIRRVGPESDDGVLLDSRSDGMLWSVDPGGFRIRLVFDRCPLSPGRYGAKVALRHGQFTAILDAVEHFPFRVAAPPISEAATEITPRWAGEPMADGFGSDPAAP